MRVARFAYVGLLSLLGAGFSERAWADIAGVWTTPGCTARVAIEPCEAGLCGTVVWLWDPIDADGAPRRDEENSDRDLRARPLLGLPILSGFRKGAGEVWQDGEIYNPEDGRTYSASLSLHGDVLKLEGCVLIFCETQTWRRLTP